jgi:hypothetical protein
MPHNAKVEITVNRTEKKVLPFAKASLKKP